MPYVRVWIHLLWSTKNREPILSEEIRKKVFDHIKANANEKYIYIDTIGGYLDHAHALISLSSDKTISKIAQLIKGESSHWINQNRVLPTRFEWQEEYFAVSVSESMVDAVREYINTQNEHHKKKSYKEEYEEFIKKYHFEIKD